MASKVDRQTTAYITVEIAADTTAKRSLRNINPLVTDVNLVDGLVLIGALQSHTVTKYSRTDKYALVSD
jgi:hypothetical protein